MIGYVLDTSVAIKWFSEKDEDDLEKALKIREACLGKICRIIVPELLFYEIANALRYNPQFTEEDVGLAIESLLKLGLETKKFDEATMKKALALAYRMKITVYDAYFIALAENSACTLVTADYICYEKIKSLPGVSRLSGVELPLSLS